MRDTGSTLVILVLAWLVDKPEWAQLKRKRTSGADYAETDSLTPTMYSLNCDGDRSKDDWESYLQPR